MERKHDWQLRLEALVRQRQTMPFAWGTNDCAIFAADCVLAMTGKDVAPPELRLHATERGAARAMKSHGGLAAIAGAALGHPQPALMARIGDVVLFSESGRDMLAICNGTSCMAPGPAGLVQMDMAGAVMCWRLD